MNEEYDEQFLRLLQNDPDAAEHYILAKDSVPEGHQTAMLLGHFYYEFLKYKLYTQGIIYFTKKIISVKTPSVSWAYSARASLFSKKGDYRQAIKDYTMAIQIASRPESESAIRERLASIEGGEFILRPNIPETFQKRGEIWFNLGEYDKAYADYKSSLQMGNSKAEIFRLLYYLPYEVNIQKNQHFYKFLHLTEKYKVSDVFTFIRDTDSPILIYRIINASLKAFFNDYPTYEGIIGEATAKTKYFKQLMDSWPMDEQNKYNTLFSKAVILYYLGDPIGAYEIFNDELDNDDHELSLFEQYYFLLSSSEILEEEDIILKNVVTNAADLLSKNELQNTLELYYCALIFLKAGKLPEAENLLISLSKTMIEARYKLLEIYLSLGDSYRDQKKRVLSEILAQESSGGHKYHLGLLPISPRLDAETFLQDIMPVIHFLENEYAISATLNQSIEFKSFFYNSIILDVDDKKDGVTSLKAQSARLWYEIVEKAIHSENLLRYVSAYCQHGKYAAQELAETIGAKARQELEQRKQYEQVQVFDFKLHMCINAKLLENKIISHEDAYAIYLYINYCMHKMPFFRFEKTFSFFRDLLVEIVIQPENFIPGFIGFQRIFKGYKVLRPLLIENSSVIMSFNVFKKIIEGNEF